MKRYFSFLIMKDAYASKCINAAIFLANPNQKWPAHITVGGPFGRKPNTKEYSEKISVLGVGNFFSDNQNTVFLKIGAENLRHIWEKTDYGFNPHLTIYDGDDHHFARDLYHRLNNRKIYFYFETVTYSVVESRAGQGNLFSIDSNVDAKFLEREFSKYFDNKKISKYSAHQLVDLVRDLSNSDRLKMIDELVLFASADGGRRQLHASGQSI
jgi:hypothetical protein